MTVKELIQALEQQNPSQEVIIWDVNDGKFYPIDGVCGFADEVNISFGKSF